MDINSKIGILGGGQLGRMLVQKAIDFNLDIACMDPDSEAPCKHIVQEFIIGDLQNYDDVIAFGKDKDIISIEIEKVNTEALADLEKQGKKVFPQPSIIALIQDKRLQKAFYQKQNIATSPFKLINNNSELESATEFLPGFYKLAKDGYDGRGVVRIETLQDISKGFDAPGLIEKAVDFHKEIAVIVSRNSDGKMKCFPLVEMVFHPEANLVDYLLSPADVSNDIAEKAQTLAETVIEKLGMVGLLAVEMFLTKSGEVLVNEIAPRTHNSGHQSIESNATSQFEQHLRSILNWPLGDTTIIQPSAMVNALGADGYTGQAKYQGLEEILDVDGVHVHLYGKKMTKPFRKMGHVTIVDKDRDALLEKINFVKSHLKIIS